MVVHFGHGLVIPSHDCGYPKILSILGATQNLFMVILFTNFYRRAYGKKKEQQKIEWTRRDEWIVENTHALSIFEFPMYKQIIKIKTIRRKLGNSQSVSINGTYTADCHTTSGTSVHTHELLWGPVSSMLNAQCNRFCVCSYDTSQYIKYLCSICS